MADKDIIVDRIDYNRLEAVSHSTAVVTLLGREAIRACREKEYAGRLGALRDIYATADSLARDIITDMRRKK